LFRNGQVNGFVASFSISGNSAAVYRWTKYFGEGTGGASARNAVALDPTGQVLAGGSFLATIDFGGISATAGMAGYSFCFCGKIRSLIVPFERADPRGIARRVDLRRFGLR